MEVIKVKKLNKYYGKVRGVVDLDFSVSKGEIFGFLGPNGAGKTTTMRLLLHLIKPTSGEAFVLGQSVTDKNYSNYLSKIGYLPGDLHLYKKMTGQQLLNFASKFYENYDSDYVDQLVDRLGCQMDRQYSKLSRGNKQKIGILLAIFHKPEVIILDEPTTGLDPITQNEVYKILKEINKEGSTVLFSSHILPEVEKICDRIGVIKDGQLVKIETIGDLKKRHVKRVNVEFVDSLNLESFKSLPGVKLVKEDGLSLTFDIEKESLNLFIKDLSQKTVKDINFTNQSLEELFLNYYE